MAKTGSFFTGLEVGLERALSLLPRSSVLHGLSLEETDTPYPRTLLHLH